MRLASTWLARRSAHSFPIWVVALSVVLGLSLGVEAEPIKVLFLGDDGPHQPQARFADLDWVLRQRGIEMTYTDQTSDLDLERLKSYNALLLYANIDSIEKPQADALLKYVHEGGGFVPLHCATYCFRNAPEVVALMGAQFQRHGTSVFHADVALPNHELMKGYGGFESWDETYVHHRHNDKNRTILEYRVDAEGREPWTWVRTHGKGRVFYTAWGHDARTWTNPGFHNLVERGIRWSVKSDPQLAGPFREGVPFPVPKMNELPSDLTPFEYEDVGQPIPNYLPAKEWGTQGEPFQKMQQPLSPQESLKHVVVPVGFHIELYASEPDLDGKPICMTWDERGRLWVAETVDYPNELKASGAGNDHIRICEDTDHDGRADKFTLFADGLSIPTSLAFSRGGVIVQNGVETLFLRDTNGDDRADERTVLISGWELGDTHGGVSNFQYGLDNWLWAMQGYNQSEPIAGGQRQQRFQMGFFRMRLDGSRVEFLRSTNNNTWGLGISEEGLIFGSTANGNPSIYMPIPNRYYERVRGWTPSLTLSSIADSNDFHPITAHVRQVDHHGGYTAGAGHALYTAREYPQAYWNRVAFVNGPTGHLVGTFILNNHGTDFRSTNPFNLLASDDEWTAPIMSEVGPDGQVWVLDWYNYIVQHNPTPKGFETGPGNAYETSLRDKKYGRIYRVVANSSKAKPVPNLAIASRDELVAALAHPTMLIRKHAQRLLVEKGDPDVADSLIALLDDWQVDEIGLNVGAIHVLWTFHGLGLLDGSNPKATMAAVTALGHPSAGVRRNAIQVLPLNVHSVDALLDAKLTADRNSHVRMAAILALADLPPTPRSAQVLLEIVASDRDLSDRWIPDALTCAAAHNASNFLDFLVDAGPISARGLEIVTVTANHYARSQGSSDAANLLVRLADAAPEVLAALIEGLNLGWNGEQQIELSASTEVALEKLLARLPTRSRGGLVKLATHWGSQRLEKYGEEIVDSLLRQMRDEGAADAQRVAAARQLVEFRPLDAQVAVDLLELMTDGTSPSLARGLMQEREACRSEAVGPEIVNRLASMTPALKKFAVSLLLKRPASTHALFDGVEQGQAMLSDLAPDQRQALASHPNPDLRSRATKLLEQGGALPNADRQKVLDEYFAVTKQDGDVVQGNAVFREQCTKCHFHQACLGPYHAIGPNLSGMAVHPKIELLIHILDPSRNVEGNFRTYSLTTVDGLTLSGMLASESRTAIELFDTEGQRRSILRDDIDGMRMSPKSIMPDGFEKLIKPDAMADLLAFLTDRGQFIPLNIDKTATLPSDRSLFDRVENVAERLIFEDWRTKTVAGIPFQLIDPRDGTVSNAIVLYGPQGSICRHLPRSVSLRCNGPAKAIHLLSGVSGWGYPLGELGSVSMTVRLYYADGVQEDHDLLNGRHFADYIRRVDVPESQFAFELRGRQIRYLFVTPRRSASIDHIELVKGPDHSAPLVMAITVESRPDEPSKSVGERAGGESAALNGKGGQQPPQPAGENPEG